MEAFEYWLMRRLVGFPAEVIRVFTAVLLAGRNTLFTGRHGIGKTTIFKCLSQAFGDTESWVVYDMSKDDLISIAGIPDAAAMSRGQLRFAQHERSIFNKRFVLLDECTRASKETQNLLLEILEEQRMFGMPLSVEVLVATCNPDSYAATFKMDQALLDRFPVVFHLPDFQQSSFETVVAIARANLRGGPVQTPHFEPAPNVDLELERERFWATRAEVQADEQLTDAVTRWCGSLVAMIFNSADNNQYVSPRTFGAHLPNVLLDLVTYERMCGLGRGELERQAEWAARHALEGKCGIASEIMERALRHARTILAAYDREIVRDPLFDLTHGGLADRIDAVKNLGTKLPPQDTQRLETLVRQLCSEILQEQPGMLIDLWRAARADKLRDVRCEMEHMLLRGKLEWLANNDEEDVDAEEFLLALQLG